MAYYLTISEARAPPALAGLASHGLVRRAQP